MNAVLMQAVNITPNKLVQLNEPNTEDELVRILLTQSLLTPKERGHSARGSSPPKLGGVAEGRGSV